MQPAYPIPIYNAKSSYIKISGYAISILTFLLAILISFFMAKKLYSPIKKLVLLMQQITSIQPNLPSKLRNSNEFEFLDYGIHNIIDRNKVLTRDLSYTLPLAYEQYLLRILNQHEFLIDEEIEEAFAKRGINFEHKYFQVALIQMCFTNNFKTEFNSNEQQFVYKGMTTLLSTLFPDDHKVFLLNIAIDKLCLVVNMPAGISENKLKEALERFTGLFVYDLNKLQIFAGAGRIYPNFSGMHASYQEAVNALSAISKYSNENVMLYNPDEFKQSCVLSVTDENKLYNYIKGGFVKETNEFLEEIIRKNINANSSETDIRKFYMQIYEVGRRVIEDKNLDEQLLLGVMYMNLPQKYKQVSPNEIIDYIGVLFDRILKISSDNTNRLDIAKIKEFIDTHYHEIVCIDSIAEKYGTTPAVLARYIKEALGMPFYRYLSNVRILKSKKLLEKTGKSISEIALAVGFNSRNTYIRMFKTREGVTPSEFRKMAQK